MAQTRVTKVYIAKTCHSFIVARFPRLSNFPFWYGEYILKGVGKPVGAASAARRQLQVIQAGLAQIEILKCHILYFEYSQGARGVHAHQSSWQIPTYFRW